MNANQFVGNDYLNSCEKATEIDPSIKPTATKSSQPTPSPSSDPSNSVITPVTPTPIELPTPPPTASAEAPSQSPAPPPPADTDPCANASVTTDFKSAAHVAHSVAGGPYVETDFAKVGAAVVELDGLGSHSHASDPDVGVITKYLWSWTDATGPKTAKGPIAAPTFPLGVTELTLEVTVRYHIFLINKIVPVD